MDATIKKQAQQAVKNINSGILTNQDLLAIVRLQIPELEGNNDVAAAIRNLVVRGAPAIGVSGAFGLALAALQSNASTKDQLITDLEKAKKILFETRPTAVNLAWGQIGRAHV